MQHRFDFGESRTYVMKNPATAFTIAGQFDPIQSRDLAAKAGQTRQESHRHAWDYQ
jgi:hypothetical protein